MLNGYLLKEYRKMQDMEKLNDQEMADVVGGISGDQALEASLKHAGLRKDQLDFVK